MFRKNFSIIICLVIISAIMCIPAFVSAEDTNLALGKPVQATLADDAGSGPDQGPANNLTDGLWKTWLVSHPDWEEGASATVDLGKIYDISSVNVCLFYPAPTVYDYTVYGSTDKTEWTTLGTEIAVSGDSAVQFDNAAYIGGHSHEVDGNYRYIKLSIIGNGNVSQWIGVQELQVFGSEIAVSPTPTLTPMPTESVASTESTASSEAPPSTGDTNGLFGCTIILAVLTISISAIVLAKKNQRNTK